MGSPEGKCLARGRGHSPRPFFRAVYRHTRLPHLPEGDVRKGAEPKLRQPYRLEASGSNERSWKRQGRTLSACHPARFFEVWDRVCSIGLPCYRRLLIGVMNQGRDDLADNMPSLALTPLPTGLWVHIRLLKPATKERRRPSRPQVLKERFTVLISSKADDPMFSRVGTT